MQKPVIKWSNQSMANDESTAYLDLIKELMEGTTIQTGSLLQVGDKIHTLTDDIKTIYQSQSKEHKDLTIDLYDRLIAKLDNIRDKMYKGSDARENLRTFEGSISEIKTKLDSLIRTVATNESCLEIKGEYSNTKNVLVKEINQMTAKLDGYYGLLVKQMDHNIKESEFENKLREQAQEDKQEIDKLKTVSRLKLISQIVSYILGASGLLSIILSQTI